MDGTTSAPRALDRLSDEQIQIPIDLIAMCERSGRWPSAIDLVVIVLLPKPDGGWPPIGLLPFLPRIWMRVTRPYLYAGAAKGATVAAWKQAARGERARAAGVGKAAQEHRAREETSAKENNRDTWITSPQQQLKKG